MAQLELRPTLLDRDAYPSLYRAALSFDEPASASEDRPGSDTQNDPPGAEPGRQRAVARALALALAAGAAAGAPAVAAPGDPLDRSDFAPAYAEEFAAPANPAAFLKTYPDLRTNYYFGHTQRSGPLSAQFTSRTYPGIRNVMVDALYCPGALSPRVEGGHLMLEAHRLEEPLRATCGNGKRDFASAMISTLGRFAQVYGYYEIRARLPAQSGTWPAFWLLPTAKTPQNKGRLAEIDVFEHYGGTRTVLSGGTKPVVIDRVGRPFSTVHYLENGVEKRATNAQAQSQPSAPRLDLKQFHTFGVLWTPREFVFYVNERETFRTLNVGVDDPHYIVVNLDVSPNGGDVADDLRAALEVDWIRAWRTERPELSPPPAAQRGSPAPRGASPPP